ncbi:MAG TPA: DinB family protein [Chitinophagaceae bacterium]|nr:DinB family protein [Chitinophagaceae bacterium]
MRKLEQLISALESNISHQELIVPDISAGSVGWHIEHSLLVLNLVIGTLSKSDPSNYKKKFDIRRAAVLLIGKIPRGKIRAPKAVQPTTEFNRDSLQQHVHRTRDSLKTLERLSPGHYFTHPFLGDFKLAPAIKFLTIHTKHHYQIIQDIVGNKQ